MIVSFPKPFPSRFGVPILDRVDTTIFEKTYEFSGLKSKSLKRRSDQRYAHFSIIGM